ncbi:MAG TPA: isochorismatase family protein [Candidatus Limnocylindrales bacterium]
MTRLLALEASVLVVVDAQPGFGDAPADGVVARIGWLAAVAAALGVPIVVTEEDPDRNGRTSEAIRQVLPETTPVLVKPVFGLADVPAILAAIEATGRTTAVLVGMETDVCVTQSALGLLDRGYRVAVVEDATYAPHGAHEAGIRRMTGAGVEVLHARGVYYEWVRSVDAARRFELEHPELREPPGFRL